MPINTFSDQDMLSAIESAQQVNHIGRVLTGFCFAQRLRKSDDFRNDVTDIIKTKIKAIDQDQGELGFASPVARGRARTGWTSILEKIKKIENPESQHASL